MEMFSSLVFGFVSGVTLTLWGISMARQNQRYN